MDMHFHAPRAIAPAPLAALALIAMCAFPLAALAQTSTGWKGGTSSDMQTSSNWDNGFGSNENLYIGQAWQNAGRGGNTTINNASGYSGYRINFENISGGSNQTFTLQGSAITLYDFGGNAPGIYSASTVNQNVNAQFTLQPTTANPYSQIQANGSGGNLTFGAAGIILASSNGAANQLRLLGNNNTITFNGPISSTAATNSVVVGDVGSNALTVVYAAANTYTGDTYVNRGTLQLGTTGGTTGSVAGSTTIHLGDTSGIDSSTLTLATTAGGQTVAAGVDIRAGNSGTVTINALNTSGTDTFTGAITVNKALSLAVATGGVLQVGTLTNSTTVQTLTKNGGGTLILGGAADNTNMSMTVASGTVVLGKALGGTVHAIGASAGATALTINSGAAVRLAGSGGDQIYDQSGVVVNGTLDFNGNNEGFEVLTGTGTVTNGATATTGTITVGAANVVSSSNTFGGQITDGGAAGALALVKSGSSTLVLTSTTNTYHGITRVTNGGAINNGVYQGGLTIAGDGSLGTAPASLVTNALTIDGATLTISGSNVQLAATRGITVTSAGGTLTNSGGSATLNLTVNSPILLQTQAGGQHLFVESGANTTFVGIVSGSGDIVKEGAGTLTLSASNSFGNTATGSNFYIDDGTVQTGISSGFGLSTGTISLGPQFNQANSGNTTLALTGGGVSVSNPVNVRYFAATSAFSKTIGSNITSGTATYAGAVILNDSVTLSSSAGGTTAFTGGISQGSAAGGQTVNGTPGVTIAGAGTVILGGSNSYGGPTTANAGTLIVTGSLSATSGVSVASGAALEVDGLVASTATTSVAGILRGTGTVGPVLDTSGTFAPGLTLANALNATGTLAAVGNVSLSSTTAFAVRLGVATGGDFDQLAISSGTISLGGANLQLTLGSAINNAANIGKVYVIVAGGAGTTGSNGNIFAQGGAYSQSGFTFNILYAKDALGIGAGNNIDLRLTAIPEPAAWAGLATGGALVAGVMRRRARRTRSD